MRKAIAILACAAAFGSCSKTETAAPGKRKVVTTVIPENEKGVKKKVFVKPAPDILDKSALGSKLAPDGTVAEESSSFKAGEPIALTIWLKQSPAGLATSATWFDADDKKIAHEQRVMNGAKVATFTLSEARLKPGKYHVVGYWGGNIAADKTFEIVAASGKRKK